MAKNHYVSIIMSFYIMSSCQKTNNYYSDPDDAKIERITHTSSNYKLAVSAMGYDNYLEILVNTESLKKGIILKNIDLKINDLSTTPFKKELYFDDGHTLYFDNFSELKDNGLTKYLIRFYFEDLKLKSPNELNLDLIIESNKGTFRKNFIMKRHSRYRIIA